MLRESVEFYRNYAVMWSYSMNGSTHWLSDRTRPFVIVLLEVPEVKCPLGLAWPPRHRRRESRGDARPPGCHGRARGLPGVASEGFRRIYWAIASSLSDPDGHTLEASSRPRGRADGRSGRAKKAQTQQGPNIEKVSHGIPPYRTLALAPLESSAGVDLIRVCNDNTRG